MREPVSDIDGWCLEDGEELHRQAPTTFWLPSQEERGGLQPGDYAKLVFRIGFGDPEPPVSVERMWVIVRERVPKGYLGILDNNPDGIEENEELWRGIELPFAPRHVINIQPKTESSLAIIAREPKRRWAKSN